MKWRGPVIVTEIRTAGVRDFRIEQAPLITEVSHELLHDARLRRLTPSYRLVEYRAVTHSCILAHWSISWLLRLWNDCAELPWWFVAHLTRFTYNAGITTNPDGLGLRNVRFDISPWKAAWHWGLWRDFRSWLHFRKCYRYPANTWRGFLSHLAEERQGRQRHSSR